MERETRVPVFESDQPAKVQLVKSKLEAQKITTYTNNTYMSFTTTPTATMVRVLVNLQDEQKAFEIIDELLKETELNLNEN
ncbi:DUF2007 domain-containing protein [Kaistella daneshvariae]|jgi:hypothetical protein|uniref:DUF2007 domain-containing protein n=1 Tax=Kaistella daneshvariae TaxID=2487074 RepID=A0A3N0WY43_9FLAO|nr:DUF2007 domain-containing protein [Kaistella daneshvariae]AZI67789.1 DUF2007 domain-containing protein [Kaistella daneshvariae]ROI10026.1 DUF2007 domain-containing protein [Kaistella daneshvariae]